MIASGVKRPRPISRDVRRSTKVNRDLLCERDEHLKRDAEFPATRGEQDIADFRSAVAPVGRGASLFRRPLGR
jgi:hypothetical protein